MRRLKYKPTSMLRVSTFLLVCGMLVGCSTTAVMSPEQLAAVLKSERGNLPQVTSASPGKDVLVGEWSGMQTELTHLLSPNGTDHRITTQTYQFFSDGKYCHRYEGYAATQIISQGLWDYANGVLTLRVYKNNMFQRLPPLKVIWHEGMIMELRFIDSQDVKTNFAKVFPGQIKSHKARYDEDGYLLQSYDLWYITNVRQDSVTSPLLMARLGEATPPPGGIVFRNQVVDDKVLRESNAAHAKYAESMLQISGNVMQAATSMAAANNSKEVVSGDRSSNVMASPQPAVSPIQQANITDSTSSKQTSSTESKTLSNKRKCDRHGIEYSLATGCPMCKAPKFGLDWEVKCTRCDYWHVSGNRCHICK